MVMDDKTLITKAFEAQKLSYSPYSNFEVGAALLTKSGTIYLGCNIESAAYSPTNCAERTAIFKAVSEGCREFSAIAVVGNLRGEKPAGYSAPCGVCRQVMMEFCQPDFRIIVANSIDDYKVFTLAELLPHAFGPEDLAKGR